MSTCDVRIKNELSQNLRQLENIFKMIMWNAYLIASIAAITSSDTFCERRYSALRLFTASFLASLAALPLR